MVQTLQGTLLDPVNKQYLECTLSIMLFLLSFSLGDHPHCHCDHTFMSGILTNMADTGHLEHLPSFCSGAIRMMPYLVSRVCESFPQLSILHIKTFVATLITSLQH